MTQSISHESYRSGLSGAKPKGTLYVPFAADEQDARLDEAERFLERLGAGGLVHIQPEERDDSMVFLRSCVDASVRTAEQYLEVVRGGCSACVTYHVGAELVAKLLEFAHEADPRPVVSFSETASAGAA